ncbi:hypothetical protein SAMN05216466_106348 [Paraburkholderia phenazinium]|uniref:ABC-type transport auxiliary lipoprotein component domain-containing protein n=1 Tax=Paraburkholderia phenazinium TaxID=60549 RepID=A0A1G7YWD4_9BURK|nr:PqiC family protein [Paraburkholderia phenazinium]SDH00882.1 hypothetical protein SAMN05216466_106348 [Paraburkholderia phenazinium]
MRRVPLLALTMLLLSFSSGCATSPASSFYTLNAIQLPEPSPAVVRPATPIMIAIGPVTVPELVDRAQIVTRVDANRVSIDEFARWADPLTSQIPRVLGADLQQLIPGAIVSTYPQRVDDNAYRVSVDVQEFDASVQGSVMLAAIWTVLPPRHGQPVSGRSVAQEAVSGPGYDPLVKAYSRALASVAGEIAAAIRVNPL